MGMLTAFVAVDDSESSLAMDDAQPTVLDILPSDSGPEQKKDPNLSECYDPADCLEDLFSGLTDVSSTALMAGETIAKQDSSVPQERDPDETCSGQPASAGFSSSETVDENQPFGHVEFIDARLATSVYDHFNDGLDPPGQPDFSTTLPSDTVAESNARHPLADPSAVLTNEVFADSDDLTMAYCALTGHETLTLRFKGQRVELVDDTNDAVLASAALTAIDRIDIRGQDDVDDLLQVDLSAPLLRDVTITFAGGAGGYDSLVLLGNPSAQVTYTAIGTDAGWIELSGPSATASIQFSGLEPVTISNVNSHTFTTTGDADVITIDSPAPGQNRISGTSGGVAFEALTFFNVANFTVDIGANDSPGKDADSITIDSAGLVASGLQTFTIKTGSGANTLEVLGDVTAVGQVVVETTGNLILAGTIQGQSLTLRGGGQASGSTLSNGGTIDLSGSLYVTGFSSIENTGAMRSSGGSISNYTTLTNGGLIETIGSGSTLSLSGGIVINQSGAVLGGEGTITLGALEFRIEDSYVVAASLAAMNLNSATVTGTGTFINESTLNLKNTSTIESTVSLVNRGLLQVAGSGTTTSVTIGGPFTNEAGGTVLVKSESTSYSGNSVSLYVTAGLTNAGVLNLASEGSRLGSVSFNMSSGVLVNTGTIISLAHVGTDRGYRYMYAAEVDNGGVINIESVDLRLSSVDSFENRATGTISGQILYVSGTGVSSRLSNAGTIDLSGSLSITGFSSIENTGAMRSSGGSISNYTTLTNGGLIENIGSGSALSLSGGTVINQSGAVLGGGGTITLGAVEFRIEDSYVVAASLAAMNLNSATVTGTGVFINESTLNLNVVSTFGSTVSLVNRGQLQVAGSGIGTRVTIGGPFTNEAGATVLVKSESTSYSGNSVSLTVTAGLTNAGVLNLASEGSRPGSVSLNMSSGVLVNTGTINSLAHVGTDRGYRYVYAAEVDNGGVINIESVDLRISSVDSFDNSGLISGPGSISINGGTATDRFTNAGTIDIAGSATLNNIGNIFGIGNIGTNIQVTAGQVHPGLSAGILNVTGNYTQDSNSSINIELGGLDPGTGFDQLNIVGSATLASQFNVSLIDGFMTEPGDTFQVMTFESLAGGFSDFNGLELGNHLFLKADMSETGLTLLAYTDIDEVPPEFTSFSPREGSRVNEIVQLQATAQDNVGVATYRFEISSDGTVWESSGESPTGQVQWDTTSVLDGHYSIRVTAEDDAGNTVEQILSYQVDNTAPAAPVLRAEPGEVLLVVAWDPVVSTDFHHYELSRSVESGVFQVVVGSTVSTLYVDRDVHTGTTYSYSVLAVDDLGNRSQPSTVASAVPLDDETAPLIRSLSPADGTAVGGLITLSATAADNVRIESFAFEYGPAGTEDWSPIGQDASPVKISPNLWKGQSDWNPDVLVEGQYTIRVTAFDYGGNSQSLTQTVIVDLTAPRPPPALTVSNPRSGNRLELIWSASADADATSYKIFRSESSGSDYVLVATTPTRGYNDSGLENGKSYFYVITALDEAGNESDHSGEAEGIPTAEADLSVAEITFEPTSPILGLASIIAATIHNHGPADAAADIAFYHGVGGTAVPLDISSISVGAGTSALATYLWTPASSGVHDITVSIENIQVTDTDSDNDVASRQVVVNTPPVAEAGDDREGDWNSSIGFAGTNSYDVDGLITAYLWDFGDGETSEHGVTPHVYRLPGTYTATLTVTDNRGAIAQDTCEVTVHDTRADLVVSNLSWTPFEPQEGDLITISATIANQGNGPTLFGFFTTFYIDGLYKGYERVNDLLQPGESLEVQFTWVATKGLHTLDVLADDIQDNIAEILENNNDAGTALTFQQIYFPYLTVEDFTCDISDTAVSNEQTLFATATIRNGGDADAFDFWVALYMDGEFISKRYVNELSVGTQQEVGFQFRPVDGVHALTLVVDDPVGYVVESDETNNDQSLTLPALTVAYPDLAVGNITILPSETVLTDGTSFDISAMITNLGTVAVEHRFKVNFYLDGAYVGAREIQYLPAGGSQTVAMQTRATPGEHIAEVVIDEEAVIAEANEANNGADHQIPEITIMYPDLIVSNLQWAPQDLKYGQEVTFTCTVSNTTVVSTLNTFMFALYVDDVQITAQQLPKLTGHSSHEFVLNWRADVDPTVGHTLKAVVDVKDNVMEQDESNNEVVVADGTFDVGDNFALTVQTPGGTDFLGTLVYTSSQAAEFVATVTMGSSPTIPVGADLGVDVLITAIKEGNYYINDEGELVQEPDEIIFENEPMTFSSADSTFRASIDLITYGTANYSVLIEATDGVARALKSVPMTVIEECIFTLATDKEVYHRGESVHVTGNITKLTGEPVALQRVAIVIAEGSEIYPELTLGNKIFDRQTRKYETFTDFAGNIDFTFIPNWGDAGLFNVSAFLRVPLVGTMGYTEFSILAADISPAKLYVTTTKNQTFTRVVTL